VRFYRSTHLEAFRCWISTCQRASSATESHLGVLCGAMWPREEATRWSTPSISPTGLLETPVLGGPGLTVRLRGFGGVPQRRAKRKTGCWVSGGSTDRAPGRTWARFGRSWTQLEGLRSAYRGSRHSLPKIKAAKQIR